MQIKYFDAAWQDIKNSPGWFGKLCLLALLSFIPIFGQLVMLAYLYGWARQIAWGAHLPMPASVFANEDGKFWRRGWFLLVISFVFGLIPAIVSQIGLNMQTAAMSTTMFGLYQGASGSGAASAASAGIGALVYICGLVLALVVDIFVWVAYMRSAIYDNISAGFQFGAIWKMIRKDTSGILKIFGMNLLVGLIVGLVASVVIVIIMVVCILVGAGGSAGLQSGGLDVSSLSVVAIGLMLLLLLAAIFFMMVGTTFVEALVARAVGYWTMQFEVPKWRGQDDPMPFEMEPPATTYPMQ